MRVEKKNIKTILVTVIAVSLAAADFLNAFAFSSADDKPLFVTITATWCNTCQKLKPKIEELEYEYQGKISFITLDTSSKYALEESRQRAENTGIADFFENNKSTLPKVGIFCPGSKLEKSFNGETRKEVYEKALDELLLNTAKICTL